jgi:Subtilase family
MAAKRSRGRGTGATPPPKPPSDQPTFHSPERKRLDRLPGMYFVRVKPDALRPHLGAAQGTGTARVALTADLADSVPRAVVEPLDFLLKNVGLKNVRPLFEVAGRTRMGRARVSDAKRPRLAAAASVAAMEDDDLAGLVIAELDPKARAATIRRAESADAIDFIEPVPARWLARTTPAADPLDNLQWGLRAVNWWEAERPDARSVRVGVIDTGIDDGHPDFAGVDIDYHHSGTRAEDIVGHGTHVSGIIAARTNNEVGIAGVASCGLGVWKVFPDEPFEGGQYYVDPDLFADALREASESGLAAVNMSIGGTFASQTEELLVRRLLDRGVAVVAAMGNEFNAGNPIEYPAAYEGVLAVGSISETRTRSFFSNTGAHIGICAPGSNVLSTLPRRRSVFREETNYASWSGTSMATPHVAGGLALVRAKRPELGARELHKHLEDTAATVPAMGGRKRTNEYGDGLLDLNGALS